MRLMMTSNRLNLIACALVLLTIQACSNPEPSWKEPISVTLDPPTNSIRYVDSMYFPQGVICGSAMTYWVYDCQPQFRLKELKRSQGEFNLEVTAVDIHLGLTVTTWYPFLVQDRLRKHEEAHYKMSVLLYNDAAQTAARDCAKDLMGQEVTVTGSELQPCKEKAELELTRTLNAAYREKMSDKADQQAQIFDRITNHGLNDVPNEEGIKRAFEEYRIHPPPPKNPHEDDKTDND